MITFKIANHQYKLNQEIVELWDNEVLMRVIYPTKTGIKVISKYIKDPEKAVEIDKSLPVSVLINLI